MKTLIELYDNNIILNICTSVYLKPENVVFICDKYRYKEKNGKIINEMFLRHCPESKVYFYESDSTDISDIIECLEQITDRFPDCAIEINGGNSSEIFAAGAFVSVRNIPVFSYNPKNNRVTTFNGSIQIPENAVQVCLSIDDFALMAGGKFSFHGHLHANELKPETVIVSDRMWKVFIKRRREWHGAVTFFQNLFRGEDELSERLSYTASADTRPDESVMQVLREIDTTGAFKSFSEEKDKLCFEIRNIRLKKMLCDYGIWLEFFVYNSAVRSGRFTAADMSVIFEWARDESIRENVTNEIDVFLVKGSVPYFISCKAGTVASSALNEIKTLSARFGSGISKTFLVTATELSEESPKIYKRAVEMGVKVIELSDLQNGRLIDKLLQ